MKLALPVCLHELLMSDDLTLQPKPPKEDKGPPPPFEPWFAIRKGEYKPIKVAS